MAYERYRDTTRHSVSVTQRNGVKIELQDVTLNRKDEYGYSLALTYTINGPNTTHELHIPRIVIPQSPSFINIVNERDYIGDNYTIDIGWDNLRMYPDVAGAAFTIKAIEEKTKEMTLEEIEKKLGHKVKIVSKETK